jgi:hypothetical protein
MISYKSGSSVEVKYLTKAQDKSKYQSLMSAPRRKVQMLHEIPFLAI